MILSDLFIPKTNNLKEAMKKIENTGYGSLFVVENQKFLGVITDSDIRRALMGLHSKELAPRSLARTLSGWRGYYAWLARHGHIAVNPTDGVKAPKRPRCTTRRSPSAVGSSSDWPDAPDAGNPPSCRSSSDCCPHAPDA